MFETVHFFDKNWVCLRVRSYVSYKPAITESEIFRKYPNSTCTKMLIAKNHMGRSSIPFLLSGNEHG